MHRRIGRSAGTLALALLLASAGSPAMASARGGAAHPAHHGHHEPLPLERLFDNQGVSEDGRPTRADLDGAGHALSAGDLRAAGWRDGAPLTLDAAPLRWPRTGRGRADNVVADGQRVRLRGAGDAVSFLVAATSPGGPGDGVSGTGRVRYRDGSSTPYTLRAPDWRSGPAATKAVGLPHLNTPDGGRLAEQARLYAVTVPVARGRAVDSVALPRDPGPGADLHVFALSVRPPATGWTGSWAAPSSGYASVGPWRDQTLRLVVHSSAGGAGARVRLANTFAAAPVAFGHASIAVQGTGAAARGRPVPLRFGHRAGVVLPAGAEAVSDPVRLRVPPDTNLLVSLHLPGPVAAAPVHTAAVLTSYASASGSGDRTREADGGAFTGTVGVWPFLTGVDVRGGPGSVVALGDSITDGVGSTRDANLRWPDVLSRRLRAQHEVPRYGVSNQGISANRVVTDRYPGDGVSTDTGGVSAQHRLERDVLAQPSAVTAVVFEGVNDVRAGTSARDVVAGLRALAARARERGLRVLAATVTPCGGYPDCTPEVEARRTAVNAFLRADGGAFDGLLDFDAVVRDPAAPGRLLPAYDSGDHLHPGDAGLRAMAESVPLGRLVP